MSKVTSKLQVTIPKAVADAYGIEAGAEIVFEPAGEVIRVRKASQDPRRGADAGYRLALFDEAMDRATQRALRRPAEQPSGELIRDRGWTREDLYDDRGSPR